MESKMSQHWAMYRGDCCELIQDIPDEKIGFSIFSPPFSSMYCYSDEVACMSNCEDDSQFFDHFAYLVPELLRVTKPGRLCSVHCMQLPSTKQHNGYIGIRDFRGEIIRTFVERGWIYHSEVCIWKDPVTAMQRTKAIGLLHKQIVKDSCMSRMGLADYVVTFRKPGVNPEPVAGEFTYYVGDDPPKQICHLSIDIWQKYASPVWSDIDQSDTLNYRMARDSKDERHICPLQKQVIERCLQLWSNPGDTVLSPFAGIGSEGYMSVKLKRRFIGFELKPSYFKYACKHLKEAEQARMVKRLIED